MNEEARKERHTYNLKDLSLEISEKFNLTQQESLKILRFTFDCFRRELAKGSQIRLHRFGTLAANARAQGAARNPMTGERVIVPSRRVVRLTVSPHLKRHVN